MAEVLALGADVQEHVAGRGRRDATAVAQRPERMELGGRPAARGEARPGVGADRHHAAQCGGGVALADGADQVRHAGQRGPDPRRVGLARPHDEGQEACAAAGPGLDCDLRFGHRRGGILRKCPSVATPAGGSFSGRKLC